MTQLHARRFEASGVEWVARLQEPAEDDASPHPSRVDPEAGIWFENAAGRHRFLRMDEDRLPSASEFRMLSGLELGRMLKRAIDK